MLTEEMLFHEIKNLMRCVEGVEFALDIVKTDKDSYWDGSAYEWARMAANSARHMCGSILKEA